MKSNPKLNQYVSFSMGIFTLLHGKFRHLCKADVYHENLLSEYEQHLCMLAGISSSSAKHAVTAQHALYRNYLYYSQSYTGNFCHLLKGIKHIQDLCNLYYQNVYAKGSKFIISYSLSICKFRNDFYSFLAIATLFVFTHCYFQLAFCLQLWSLSVKHC